MKNKTALITGITGQDGAYLVELLLAKNYIVHGVKRQTVLEIAPEYFRPTEVDSLLGDASKAREKLGWKPEHSFDDLVFDMINGDLVLFRKSKLLKDNGHEMLCEHMD
ncbi:MAG: hypothetical protein ACD_21C00014G0005 [uncultured bacterium]|nr:MAG: hypothetical protein ACD_21C00014G0005 [uncultured bacterium]